MKKLSSPTGDLTHICLSYKPNRGGGTYGSGLDSSMGRPGSRAPPLDLHFPLLDPLLADRKCTKNPPPQKASRNLKISSLGRPRLDFSSILQAIVAPIFHENSEQPKTLKTQQVSNGSSVITARGLPFRHQLPASFHVFS